MKSPVHRQATPASGSRARAAVNRGRVAKHHDDLVSARDDAQEESLQKSEFVATASHELRTPMNGVIGLARLLLDTELDATQRSLAEGIIESAEALLHVVDETLDFSKLEAGKLELESADFDLTRAIESVAVLVSVSAHAKQLTLHTEIARDVPTNLRGDEGRLRQVLFNLLGNAVKFTDAGTVTIRASVANPRATGARVTVRIEVEDTGLGIAGDPSRLFEPFSQASPTTSRRYGGTGLGLAICARLVGAMGGAISVRSHPGKGSIFRIDVPFALGSAPELRDVRFPSAGVVRQHRAKDRGVVLIVDDNGINRLVAGQMVGNLGFLCDTANNGIEALAMLGRRDYAAVLMDCFMPEMDGFDTTTELRRREGSRRHTTVIATTAGALDGDRDHCEASGMDDYLCKPLTLDHLETALARSGVGG